MISWSTIFFGGGLSALAAAVALAVVARRRPVLIVVTAAVAAAAGPIAWNAILRAAHGDQFFTDAPVAVFPVSWQDAGSGVFAFAAAALLYGLGPQGSEPARRMVIYSLLAGLAALVVDVYLY
jgi:hypothetical protein